MSHVNSMSDLDGSMRWLAIAPGVMALPQTSFQIRHIIGSSVPYRVFWADKETPNGAHFTLGSAQQAAERYMQELICIGYEP